MKASELVAEIKKWINIDGDLEIKLPGDGNTHENIAGLAKSDDDYFIICDDNLYDLYHVGGDESESPELTDDET
jgi:hypothetical protein